MIGQADAEVYNDMTTLESLNTYADPPPEFTWMSVSFLLVFLLQIFAQQFVVRLAPYLFGARVGASTIVAATYIGALFTDLSAVVGIALLVVSFYYFYRIRGFVAKLLSLDLLGLALVIGVMDGMRVVLPSQAFSHLYGNGVWTILSSALLAFVLFSPLLTIFTLRSFRTNTRGNRGRSYLYLFAQYMAGGALFLVAFYFVYENFAKSVTSSFLGVVYNGGINLMGLTIVLSYLFVLGRAGLIVDLASILGGAAVSGVMGYILFGNYFSLKIFELTWQTSFGAPLPAYSALVYSFFLGALLVSSVGLWVRKKSAYILMIPAGIIVLASSTFLLGSLSIYIEGAVLGYLIFAISAKVAFSYNSPR